MTQPVNPGATVQPTLRVLCVYGVPPVMPLKDAAGRDLGRTFSLTNSNKASFEAALKQAMAIFVGSDAHIMSARFVFVGDLHQIGAAVRSGNYTQLMYYGHADLTVNALIPAPKVRITASQLAQVLRETGVSHADLLGCRSTSFAAELATLVPRLRVGHLMAKRYDNIEVDPRTLQVIKIIFDRQPLLHFEPKER